MDWNEVPDLTAHKVRLVALSCLFGSVAFLVLGNLAILSASYLARHTTAAEVPTEMAGVAKLRTVDAKLWRGAAPTTVGYESLAKSGVTTIVDLRAEDGLEADGALVKALGMKLVRIPIRDGQVPSTDEVRTFLDAAHESPGQVFVHCGAGVGRTGAMVGAYMVANGELNNKGALRLNLAIGPPSLEQLAFVAGLADGDATQKPGTVLTAVSRVLDAPRRLWSQLS